MIASAIPDAISPYSIAVAAVSSFTNLIIRRMAVLRAYRQLDTALRFTNDFEFSSGADRCGRTLPTARRNQASKIYHAEAPARPGIGSEIGNADRTPIIARQPDITNNAIFGARNMKLSQLLPTQLLFLFSAIALKGLIRF